jgi:hypothetical protein
MKGESLDAERSNVVAIRLNRMIETNLLSRRQRYMLLWYSLTGPTMGVPDFHHCRAENGRYGAAGASMAQAPKRKKEGKKEKKKKGGGNQAANTQ